MLVIFRGFPFPISFCAEALMADKLIKQKFHPYSKFHLQHFCNIFRLLFFSEMTTAEATTTAAATTTTEATTVQTTTQATTTQPTTYVKETFLPKIIT